KSKHMTITKILKLMTVRGRHDDKGKLAEEIFNDL
ncbi:hypothetical protein SS7213T_02483, partial [Staphylococcus simiae CCM 7213 = CCUG 51256]